MSEFTPGPWRVEPYTPVKCPAPTSWCIYADNDAGGDPADIIAEVYGREPINENARLIALAPDLLAVLETTTAMLLFEAVSIEERGEPDKAIPIRGQVALARAVIKKATEEIP